MSVLVTYASATGSTVKVAERIAERLKQYIANVDCLPIREVSASSLSTYSAIIIGSAVQWFHWLSPARKFLHKHTAVLRTKPVWAFSVGFPGDESEAAQEEQSLGEEIRKDVPDLLAHKFFWGRWRRRDAGVFPRILLSLLAPQRLERYSDDRNWDEIE